MSETKWTEGPWQVDFDVEMKYLRALPPARLIRRAQETDDRWIGLVVKDSSGSGFCTNADERDANASLIAAAPQLHSGGMTMLAIIEQLMIFPSQITEAEKRAVNDFRALLAKIGGSP